MKYIATTLATTDGAEQLKIMSRNSNHVNKTYFIKYSLKKMIVCKLIYKLYRAAIENNIKLKNTVERASVNMQ